MTLQIQTDEPLARPAPAGVAQALWGRAFRPFFLGAGAYGFAFVTVWIAVWRGAVAPPAWLQPTWWHAHEMIFGVVAAAVAGFLLTAAPVWAGRKAVAGRPLVALVALWALGRVAMLGAGLLPAGLVALVDVAFLPLVAVSLARTLWRAGQRWNHGVVALVVTLAIANAAVHAEALGLTAGSAPRALRFAVDLVIALIVLIGGRITPGFTTNALVRLRVPARATSRPGLDRFAVAAVVALAAVDLAAPHSVASGAVAAVAGLAVAARMTGWQTLETWRDPLVWSLHAGMLWVVAGLLLVAAGDLGGLVPATAGLHALTAGAMGTMILAVVTRVGLGHTGRFLELPKGAAASYLLVQAGAAARVLAPLAPDAAQGTLLVAGGLLWAAAFGLFAILYGPILLRPRVDGKEG